jgi:hypothetical protein
MAQQSDKEEQKPRQGRKWKGKQKRKRTESDDWTKSRTTCKACYGTHPLPECFYAFKDNAPEGWKANPGLQKLVKEKVELDKSLYDEIERIRREKDTVQDS